MLVIDVTLASWIVTVVATAAGIGAGVRILGTRPKPIPVRVRPDRVRPERRD